MAPDEFKTQVLLLHSEQSTLDSLSSGFSDSYTVHCATTGSEALNTLVDTPINVIVSAQDLPGMSGLEALREAKKRSPDTIGILLAGNDGDELEALVGDKEVFQVVRGSITSDAILALVDNATQQVRLTTLAESANDTAANVDEPQSEHIVMETAENGSALITDATGKMRAFAPAGGLAAASIGSRAVDLLVLTKDQDFLGTIKESSRAMHTVHYATTLAQAVETIREHKVGVAVVDAAMVGERVEQLTQHLRKASARLVSIVAGRRDDGEMLMDLINRGKVYRFLLKPVSPGRARLAVEASVKHHLEAPDAALDSKGAAAATPTTAQPKTPSSVASKTGPAAKSRPASTPSPKQPATPAALPPLDPAVDSKKDSPAGEPPICDGLADAFDDGDSNFTETVAGLISSVGQKFSAAKDADSPQQNTGRVDTVATPAVSASRASPLRNPMMLGIGGVTLVLLATATFWFMSGSDGDAVHEQTPREQTPLRTPTVTEPDTVVDAAAIEVPASENPGSDIGALVEEARLARDAGQIFEPDGDNAIELYAAAIDAKPDNAMVAAELDAVIQQTLGLVESALLDSRLDEASSALQRVISVEPDNARLPFLAAQLTQMQLRAHLATARTAMRESRYADAENAIASARLLGISDGLEIDAVADELTTARSAQRAEDVLAMGNARLEDNDLLSPPNDNARYFYELALSIDPENSAASQGLRVVASKLAMQARSEIDNGDLESAQQLLDEANAIDPSNSELAAAVTALSGKRDAIAAQRKQEEVQRRAAAERRAAEQRAAEEQAAEEQAAAERAAEEQAAAAKAEEPVMEKAAQPKPVPSSDENAASASARASTVGTVAADENAGSNEAVEDRPGIEKLQAKESAPSTTQVPQPVAIRSLKRTKYVAPKYPRGAQRRNLSGWVDVVFTVAIDGTVKDVAVRESEPGEIFVDAATRAVEKWKFEPVVENDATVEKRAAVRMMFAVE